MDSGEVMLILWGESGSGSAYMSDWIEVMFCTSELAWLRLN